MLTNYLHLIESMQTFLAATPKEKLECNVQFVIQQLSKQKPSEPYIRELNKKLVSEWFVELEFFLIQSQHAQSDLEDFLNQSADIIGRYLSNRL